MIFAHILPKFAQILIRKNKVLPRRYIFVHTNFSILDACYYKNEDIPYTDRVLRIHFQYISFFYFL